MGQHLWAWCEWGQNHTKIFSTALQNWPPSRESLLSEKGHALSSPFHSGISTLASNWLNKLLLSISTGHTGKVSASRCLQSLRNRHIRRGVSSLNLPWGVRRRHLREIHFVFDLRTETVTVEKVFPGDARESLERPGQRHMQSIADKVRQGGKGLYAVQIRWQSTGLASLPGL